MTVLANNWKTLIKPYRVRAAADESSDRVSEFVFEPLEVGFGVTLGNAVRRVLLSSLRGAAVTSVKLAGALHMFSTLRGVVEDVSEIIMNLGGLDIVMPEKEKAVVSLSGKLSGQVTAGMFEKGSGVEFLNPDQIVCHITQEMDFDLQITVENGKGFRSSECVAPDQLSLGTMAVDADFNPVRFCSFNVESTRVGQFTNYDRLVLRIETDGSVTPKDALSSAACILQEQLSAFVSFAQPVDFKAPESDTKPAENFECPDFNKRVEELDLSLRSFNCLKREGVLYVGDLVKLTEDALLRTPNFGNKSLGEIVDALKQMGLRLGMSVGSWKPPHANIVGASEETAESTTESQNAASVLLVD